MANCEDYSGPAGGIGGRWWHLGPTVRVTVAQLVVLRTGGGLCCPAVSAGVSCWYTSSRWWYMAR